MDIMLLEWRILNHVCRLQFGTLDFFYIELVRITQLSLVTFINLWNPPLTPDTQASIFRPIYIEEQTQMSCTNTFLQCLFSSLWCLSVKCNIPGRPLQHTWMMQGFNLRNETCATSVLIKNWTLTSCCSVHLKQEKQTKRPQVSAQQPNCFVQTSDLHSTLSYATFTCNTTAASNRPPELDTQCSSVH